MSTQKLATQALHAGHDTTKSAGTRAVPIYQTTSYVFNNTEQAANLFSLKELGFIYTRLNNPTNDILQQRLATIEGGIGAVVFASGTSAISTTFLTLLKAGVWRNFYTSKCNVTKIRNYNHVCGCFKS